MPFKVKKQAYLTTSSASRKITGWLQKLRANSKHWKKLDLSEAALLVIDMQNFFLDPEARGYVPSSPYVKEKVTQIIKKFKEQGRPIVYTTFASLSDKDPILNWWENTISPDSKGADVELPEEHADLILRKETYSAFLHTKLEEYLRSRGVKTIVITGVLSNLCCENTARAGFDRGFNVFFVMDATAAYNEDFHLATLLNLSYGVATPLTASQIYDL
jgi:nicotinamidase-related amidase